MKKYVAILGSAILVVALVSTAAMAQFKAFGHMEVETYWTNNMKFNDDLSDNRRGVAERFRLHFTYGDPKTVQAYVMLEADSGVWGEASSPSASGGGITGNIQTDYGGPTGVPGLSNQNHMGTTGTDQNALEIAWAFLDFTVPNTPLTARIGLQRFVIGGDIGRFWQGRDNPGVIVTANFAPHALQAFWWKENKQNTLTDNDNDVYGLRYLLRQKAFNIEAWFAYENDRRSQTETWSLPASGAGATAPFTGTASFVPTRTITARGFEVKPWWLGINAPMSFGNLRIDPIFIYLGGKAQDATVAGVNDVDYQAWLADLALTYRLGPGLSFTAEGFWATGRDSNKGGTDNRYAFPNNSEARTVFGNGKSVFFFSNTELTYYGYRQRDAGGIAYARANAEYAPLSWLNLGFNYFYLVDTSKGAGSASNVVGARTDKNETLIGHEINVISTIKIYQNFIYKIAAAYFIAGDVFENAAFTPNKKPDDGWSVLTNLRYNF